MKDKQNLHILIIEDNPGDFALVEEYLREEIATPDIVHARNFVQSSFILLIEKVEFDVILLDLTLPDKNGKDLITEILKMARNCPVIILTGFSNVDFSINSISQGISDYMLKDDLNAASLYKSIVYGMERKKQLLELKESENRYSDLFHYSPQSRWVYDPQTFKCLQVNKAATDCYGYSEHEFLTMNINILETAGKKMKSKETGKMGAGKEIFAGRQRHYKKSGDPIEVEIYSNPIFINDTAYISVLAIDITEKILYDYKITRAIIKTQEDERYEIGAELHDNVCQILASSLMAFRQLKDSLEPASIDLFNKSQEYILLATDEIRNLSHRLAPSFFNETTLEEAFQRVMNEFNTEKKFKVSLYFDISVTNAKISMDLQLNLYRILQEQLSNILKYAEATIIKVDVIIFRQKLKMLVTDDGIGFNVDKVKAGIGISNMKRRAELFYGKLEINSSKGNGCEMVVEIPLNEIAIAV